MNQIGLVRASLRHYWRTNAAVVAGVATAVAVLSGALLVGDSVRGSLRDLVLQRLGRADRAVVSSDFFREALADELGADAAFSASFSAVCPLVAVQGLVSNQATGRRVSRVEVYGVDDRFWQFHGATEGRGPGSRDALVSHTLAADLGVRPGDSVLVRIERPSAVPIESLHGRKEDLGRTLRLTIGTVLSAARLGDFSLRPNQGDVRAVFVSLSRLQQEIDRAGRVNTLLVADRSGTAAGQVAPLESLVARHAGLEDIGLRVRAIASPGVVAVESQAGVLDEARATAVERASVQLGAHSRPVLTYLVNAMRGAGGKAIPYSLVTATDLASVLPDREDARQDATSGSPAHIVINQWAARDLGAKVGDSITLDYYVWEDPGRLVARSADFMIAAVVPIAGAAADRDFAPTFPGISNAETLGDWDPPFPIDLSRVRPIDEDYWRRYRTTPKAFVSYETGRRLWRSRYGDRTSVRIAPLPGLSLQAMHDAVVDRLRHEIEPLAFGLNVQNVRADGLAASRGATDFGEYFTYFSFFLVASALLLAALFFRLGVEQRAREVGLLRAVGFTPSSVRRLFAFEALLLAGVGSALGVIGAVAYGYLMMTGLRTWWVGAVGTSALRLHVSAGSLLTGAVGTLIVAWLCIWATLRGLARLSERRLLAGELPGRSRLGDGSHTRRRFLLGAVGGLVLGAIFIGATLAGAVDRTAAFFAAGSMWLAGCLCFVAFVLQRPPRTALGGQGWWPVSRIGLRNAADRTGRTVLAIGVMASATFILISVDAFRRNTTPPTDPHSGVGGYPVLVDLLLPLAHDPNSPEGRDILGLTGQADVRVEPFRVLQGDDASCLNLYEPRRPRILGASRTFIESGRFAFQSTRAASDAERANPWLLLNREETSTTDLVVPVIADANSLTYVLHRKLGDDIEISAGGRTVRLRLVAALADSIFQSELMMSEANFRKIFPNEEGYRFLLVEAPAGRVQAVAQAIERSSADIGADVVSTSARLQEFHKVENTYLSTFQALGGLGLLIGTIGLGAVLLRNVLERRRELALLGAVGYRPGHIFMIVVAENVLLLVWGLAIGTICALVAIGPALADRGGWPPLAPSGWLLIIAVFACGLLSSIVATRVALRSSLLGALRAE